MADYGERNSSARPACIDGAPYSSVTSADVRPDPRRALDELLHNAASTTDPVGPNGP